MYVILYENSPFRELRPPGHVLLAVPEQLVVADHLLPMVHLQHHVGPLPVVVPPPRGARQGCCWRRG